MADTQQEKLVAADQLFAEIEGNLALERLEERLAEEESATVLEAEFPPVPKEPKVHTTATHADKKEYQLKPHLTTKPFRGHPALLQLRKELKR